MKLKITIDGKQYEVDVEVADDNPGPSGSGSPAYYAPPQTVSVPAPLAAPQAGGAPAAVANEEKVCRSPIAGIVVRVNAQPGQQIQVNDPLLVLEAMKMETNITAPVAGRIKQINAGVGDPVQTGQVVVEFE